MTAEDIEPVVHAFHAQGWNKPQQQYLRYLEESSRATRTVLLAEYAGEFAGYVTVVWESNYAPFRNAHIPEIVDFNVLIKYRRRGVGTALMDEAERQIAARSPVAGIGVGLTADYGAAQVLYSKRGYVPDGRGAIQRGQAIRYGEQIVVDDDLVIYLTRCLWVERA
jgi:ribosomal protein S18 acetylase RimI-like enzyme